MTTKKLKIKRSTKTHLYRKGKNDYATSFFASFIRFTLYHRNLQSPSEALFQKSHQQPPSLEPPWNPSYAVVKPPPNTNIPIKSLTFSSLGTTKPTPRVQVKWRSEWENQSNAHFACFQNPKFTATTLAISNQQSNIKNTSLSDPQLNSEYQGNQISKTPNHYTRISP